MSDNRTTRSDTTCPRCGGSTKPQRKGSLTQWVFRPQQCTCGEEPAPVLLDETLVKVHQLGRCSRTRGEVQRMLSPAERRMLGDDIDLLSVLGEGGMGTVYLGRDQQLGRNFAVKVLKEELIRDEQAIARFEQEWQADCGMTDAHIVSIYGHGRAASGAPYVVMEYVEGCTLADVMAEQSPLPPDRVIDIFIQVCAGMAHAHSKGIIHRDLKPGNIMLTEQDGMEFAKVVDFGIAKLPGDGTQMGSLTTTGEVFGSPRYMSPEQCCGDALDARSDVYSIGCVLYEALTGQPCFNGDGPVAVIVQHLCEAPLAMARVRPGLQIPPELDRVVMHCLEKDPAARYQNMTELRVDLEAIKNGKLISVARAKQTQDEQEALDYIIHAMYIGSAIAAACLLCWSNMAHAILAPNVVLVLIALWFPLVTGLRIHQHYAGQQHDRQRTVVLAFDLLAAVLLTILVLIGIYPWRMFQPVDSYVIGEVVRFAYPAFSILLPLAAVPAFLGYCAGHLRGFRKFYLSFSFSLVVLPLVGFALLRAQDLGDYCRLLPLAFGLYFWQLGMIVELPYPSPQRAMMRQLLLISAAVSIGASVMRPLFGAELAIVCSVVVCAYAVRLRALEGAPARAVQP